MARATRFPFLPLRLAGRVTLGYVVLAGLWILLSDRLLGSLVRDPELLVRLSVAKGWCFVAVTGLLLYVVLATQADARLALLRAVTQARVAPFAWEPARGLWRFHPEAVSLLGCPSGDLARPGALERLLAPEDLPRLAKARVQGERLGWATFEARLRLGDGHLRWTRWTLRKAEQGFDGIVQDISEMHSIREHLVRRQKQEVLSLTAAGLAHDLKNLFQAVRSSSELLALEPGSRSHKAMGILHQASQRGETMLQSLLRLIRDRSPEDHPLTDLNALVHEAAALLRLALPTDFRIEVDLDPGLPLLPLDPGQVIQVLMNLGLNARDAQGATGVIRLHTGRALCPFADQPCIFAEVEDAGPGIPEAIQAKLFTPFFTTKGEGAGTGLGLTTALAIAQAHNGNLTCDSGPGRGTRFRLWLPVAQEA